MLTAVEGVYEDGHIELRETPPSLERTRVIVTFLPEESRREVESVPSKANRRMLEVLHDWQDEPLAQDEADLLDEFSTFQARHPVRLARWDDEP